MKNRTLLYLMNASTPDSDVEAMEDSARAQEARLVCLVLGTAPSFPPIAYGGLPYAPVQTTDWASTVQRADEALGERSASVAALLDRMEVAGMADKMLAQMPDLAAGISRHAMLADLVSIAPNLREDDPDIFRLAAHGVLFDSPAPLVLNRNPLAPAERVFVGWNGSLHAARAIRAALPILREASEVMLAVFDPRRGDGDNPGSEMAEWLSHHGCDVTVNQYPSGGELVGEAMRKRATETGADLVVMGAYGRSRMRERVFGGSTRTMLTQTRVPVLMAH